MTAEKVFLSLKREIRIIIISFLSFLLLASLISFFLIKPKYEATSKVFIGKEKFVKDSDDYTNEEITMYKMMLKTYIEVLNTKDFAQAAIAGANQDLLPQQVLKNTKITPVTDTQIIDIKYISNNKEEAYNLTYELTKEFVNTSRKLYPKVNIQVLEQPNIPEGSISPNNLINIIIGGVMGLAFGVSLVLMREYLDKRVRRREDLEVLLGLPNIGVIPNYKE